MDQFVSVEHVKGARGARPVIIYGRRRIVSVMLEAFKARYQEFSESLYQSNPHIKAVYAFPDHQEPDIYWHMLWLNCADSFSIEMLQPPEHSPLSDSYKSTEDDPDTLMIYGGWTDKMVSMAKSVPSVRCHFMSSLAGYIKCDGAGEAGPALIGFTVRHVKPGRLKALGSTFQTVCNSWYRKVPGILMAAVFPDESSANVVHDLRAFSNHEAYLAHIDKSDKTLTAAMAAWFDHYDTSIPFSGQMFAADTRDEALHTSSIKPGRTPRARLDTFHYGEDGMLGVRPHMTRGES